MDPESLASDVVTSVAIFNDQLYVGTQNAEGHSSIWRTADGTQWTKVLDFYDLGEPANYYVWRMIPFHDKLYVSTMNVGPIQAPGVTGAQIWVTDSGDPGSYYNLVHNGFDGATWTTYTKDDGLVDDYVDSIAVAPNGVIWFGAGDSVSRYDGETWTTFTKDDGLASYVQSIAVGPDGALWFGTYRGISRYLPPE